MAVDFPFDPVKRSEDVEQVVMRGGKRLYHKFRAAPYYGGIATADAVGCSFLCAYCWNYGRNENPAGSGRGRFYSPEEVAENLLLIARRRAFRLFRVTGSEPVLGEASFRHLMEVIRIVFEVAPQSRFILETNGLILGYRKELAQKLKFKDLLVRVAIKGPDSLNFEKITGARRDFFPYPFLALNELEKQGVKAWPAVMREVCSDPKIKSLRKLLEHYEISADLELEVLERYPFVLENLRRRNILVRE